MGFFGFFWVGFFGWVFYCQPWFEVRIDKKINSWSGSIEVGVTCCDPSTIDVPFPSSATELREGTWIMSGNSILKAGGPRNSNLTQMVTKFYIYKVPYWCLNFGCYIV